MVVVGMERLRHSMVTGGLRQGRAEQRVVSCAWRRRAPASEKQVTGASVRRGHGGVGSEAAEVEVGVVRSRGASSPRRRLIRE